MQQGCGCPPSPLYIGPLGGRRPWEIPSPGPEPPPPQMGLYKGGGREGSRTRSLGASLSPCYTSSSRSRLAKPGRNSDASTTTLSCCWIFINLSFP